MRLNQFNNQRTNNTPTVGDRVISVLSYLTAGLVGFIWIILAHVSKKNLKFFVKFHAYQSIFISIIYYLFITIIGILLAFLKIIPIVGTLVLALVFYLAQMPIILGYSLLNLVVGLITLYLIYTAATGKISELPWVSDTIKKLM